MEEMPESDGVMDGENATEYADFHTASEFTEGITERDENSTDHSEKMYASNFWV
jgi:hypothetical protein